MGELPCEGRGEGAGAVEFPAGACHFELCCRGPHSPRRRRRGRPEQTVCILPSAIGIALRELGLERHDLWRRVLDEGRDDSWRDSIGLAR